VPSKQEALSSNPRTKKKKKTNQCNGNKFKHTWPTTKLIFDKGTKKIQWEKVSLINDARKTGLPHVKE
jgi:hypothetical protein